MWNKSIVWMALLASLCAPVSLSAQNSPDDPAVPRCSGIYNLCGHTLRKSGTVVIDHVFEKTEPFSEGMAAVRLGGKWGYIDLAGDTVIAPQFDLAGQFTEGLAEVLISDQVGVIDLAGEFVTAHRFKRAVALTSQVLIAADGRWPDGELPRIAQRRAHDLGLSDYPAIGMGLYHLENGWLTSQDFVFQQFSTDALGMVWAASSLTRRDKLWGLMRDDGTWRIPPDFINVGRLNEDRAVVTKQLGKERSDWRSGAVNGDGEVVIPIEYARLQGWEDGFGLISKNGRQALVFPDGRLVADRYFEDISRNYYASLGPRVFDGSVWWSVTADGQLIDDQREGFVSRECPSGLAFRHRGDAFEIVKPGGELAANYTVDFRRFSRRDCNTPVRISVNEKWGFVTQDGLVFTDPPSFDHIGQFEGGFAPVNVNGLWGIVNQSGSFTVEPQFENFSGIRNGAAKVEHRGRTFFITPRGEEVPEPLTDDTNARAAQLRCGGGVRKIEINRQWGLVGPNGILIIAPKYRAISCFRNGVVYVPDDTAQAWCTLGVDGRRRADSECKTVYYPVRWSHHSPERLSPDRYESSVIWNQTLLDYGSGRSAEPPYMVGDGVQGHGRWPAVTLSR